MRTTAEVELLNSAIEALSRSVGLSVITTSLEEGSCDLGYDAIIRIGRNSARTEYAVLIRKYITNEILGALASQLRRTKPPGILVTHHITSNQSEKLKKLNLPFFDTAGNAFIIDEAFYAFVSGRRQEYDKPREKPSRAFQPSGQGTVFAVLCNPGLEMQGCREIASDAKVPRGTIGLVMNDLQIEGYLIDMGAKGRRLTKKADLIRRWTVRYPQQLRPKLLLARYSTRKSDWWKDAHPARFGALWGRGSGSSKTNSISSPTTQEYLRILNHSWIPGQVCAYEGP